jgi:hypothetical protein
VLVVEPAELGQRLGLGRPHPRSAAAASASTSDRTKAPICPRRAVPHALPHQAGQHVGVTTPAATASSKSWHT